MSLSKFGFTECELPPPKKQKTDEEKREVGRLYDKDKRQRTFKHSWLVEFSWLIYDPNTNKMCCLICRSTFGPLAVNKLPDHGIFRKYSIP